MISIIVPCYNQAQYLSEALDSVLNQTYTHWECIIVNDGSPDNTDEVAGIYLKKDERFKYLKKENGGLSSARNAGIKIAAGDYILPLDADDIIAPEYIELSIKAFSESNDLTLVYCKALKFGYEATNWELEPYLFDRLLLSNCIFCSAIYKKTSWIEAGGYDEALKKGWEDWDFWIKILDSQSKVYCIPQTLFYYRTQQHSMIKAMSTADEEKIRWHIYNKHIKTYQSLFSSPITIISENIYMKKKINNILTSKSYTMGNFFLTPFSYLKSLLSKSINNK